MKRRPFDNYKDHGHRTKSVQMNSDKQLNAIFMTLLEVEWLRKERFRDGLTTLLKEAAADEEFEAIQHVLKKLTYCRSDDLIAASSEAAKQIVEGWRLTPGDSLIVGVAERGKTCGSTAYLRCIETSLPRTWSASNAVWTTTDAAFRHRNQKPNLIIVDDFVGTGEKLTALLSRLSANPKTASYTVHVCAFAAMEAGWDHVSAGIDQRFIAHRVLQKCISDLLQEPKRSSLLSAMLNLEKGIFNKPGDFNLGYMKSEASFYLEGFNIPNNAFPVLWWEQYANQTERKTLFSRR